MIKPGNFTFLLSRVSVSATSACFWFLARPVDVGIVCVCVRVRSPHRVHHHFAHLPVLAVQSENTQTPDEEVAAHPSGLFRGMPVRGFCYYASVRLRRPRLAYSLPIVEWHEYWLFACRRGPSLSFFSISFFQRKKNAFFFLINFLMFSQIDGVCIVEVFVNKEKERERESV
ncbi:hypothetical protein MPH_04942 [Macrophomina phaseolina MS6]|uniref:Secreted protein n=1 Tax=Macrophomina phaseolina (strain MS6) TaxID=1126212 RepID=K2SLZ4_MACPH|nr:hypothetical protein MPH_04942 [Macrophomina phaseolina MS6]